jgi:hypothetical protein
MVAALIAPAVLVFMPTAAAQNQGGAGQANVQVAITPYTTPIKPLTDLADIQMAITYSYTSTNPGLIQVPITITADAPPWAIVVVSPSTVYAPVSPSPGGLQGSSTSTVDQPITVHLLVSTTQNAPAFSQGTITVKAVSGATQTQLPSATGTAQTNVEADYFSIIDAVATSTIQQATPQSEVAYPITVTNLGNAQTKFFFNVDPHTIPDGWQVVPPAPITLGSTQQGDKSTQATVSLQIQTPYHNGYLNQAGAITVQVLSSYALNAALKGDTSQITTLTTDRGFYVPGFDPMFALAALGGVALILRRRF